jgi:hypothetical protein
VRAIEIQNDRGIGSNIALPNHLAEFFNRIGPKLTSTGHRVTSASDAILDIAQATYNVGA